MNNDDVKLHNYQDDLDTDDNKWDKVTAEMTDDPTEELGINPNEFRNELNQYATDETNQDDDDRREQIEGNDTNMGENDN
jgi:hypothetical protein